MNGHRLLYSREVLRLKDFMFVAEKRNPASRNKQRARKRTAILLQKMTTDSKTIWSTASKM